jgi:serine/threonine protein kinase/Tfp pilus assembly protein PilF
MNTAAQLKPEVLTPDPEDVLTVRNWVGELPQDLTPEPAIILENLRAFDSQAATRLGEAVSRFPEVGEQVAGFRLVTVLGRGAFGRVYLACQGDLADRFVALKVSANLAGESRTLARLQHTNIVPIYSAHRAGPLHAVCMPYFGATTLAHLLHRLRKASTLPTSGRQLADTLTSLNDESGLPPADSRSGGTTGHMPVASDATADEPDGKLAPRPIGPLDHLRGGSYPAAVCWLGARVADGLAHAHAHGILHNDLKPANVLLTDDGQPMLLDFGISEDLKVRVAVPGNPVGGTLPYMAPEHLRSVRDKFPTTDARSDVYALGIILFELLTGRHPFRVPEGKVEDELPRMIAERSAPPPRLRPHNPAVSPGLEAIVRACLDPDPGRRYQAASDLRDDLDRHRADQPLKFVRVPSLRERVRKWSRRHPKLTSNAVLGAATAVVLAGTAAGLFARQESLERDRAAAAAAVARAEADAASLAERYKAAEAVRGLTDDLRVAHYLLSTRPPEPALVAEGAARCEAALARYGLPDDGGWEQRAEFAALPPAERVAARGRLIELCLLLARANALQADPGGGDTARLTKALHTNELAERVAGGAPPRVVWDQRVVLLRRLERVAEADQFAAKARTAPRVTASDFHLAGSEALAAGRHAEAAELFRQAVELDPAHFWAHLGLGQCHESHGRLPEAIGCYTTAVALWPHHAGGYRGRGLVALRVRDFAGAKADLTRAIDRSSSPTSELYLNRALAYQGLKDFPAGLADLEAAAGLGAPRTRVLLMRARLRELAGDKPGAAADLAAGMMMTPADDVGWVTRGNARVTSDPAGAVTDYDAALKLNPRSLTALQNKAHALSKQGRNADAIRALDRLLELYPDFSAARAGRAVLHARVGDAAAALADAAEARRRDTSSPITYQVAGVYALLDGTRPGARAEAIRLLSAALRAGFGHDMIETDKDLDPIRKTPEFERLVGGVRALKPKTN